MPEAATKWIDQSGHNNNGTLSGAVFVDRGRRGPAMYFDGINDYVNITAATSFQNPPALSIETWIYPTHIGGENPIRTIARQQTGGSESFSMYFTNDVAGRINFVVFNNLMAWGLAYNLKCKPANVWHHVVGTWNGLTIRLYVDGVIGTNGTRLGPVLGNQAFKLSDPNFPFKGLMDEFRYYKRELKQPEITALYMQGKP